MDSKTRLTYWGAVAILSLFLASCASLTGNSGNVDANAILLRKAEDRVSVAQNSVKEATDLIAEGERNKLDGQKLIEQGQNKVDTGKRLKAAADVELVRAQKQVDSVRSQIPAPQ
ncbi:MAG: hypothetical protein WA138_13755 [Parvibaculum sp.]